MSLNTSRSGRRHQGRGDAFPREAERITGYHVGGISPFGQRRRVRVFVEEAALAHATVISNGGRRGLQIELAPADLVRVLDATGADVQTSSL